MKTITVIFILLAVILLTIVNRFVFLRTKSENVDEEKNFNFLVCLNIGIAIAFIKPLFLLDTYTDFNYLDFGFSFETLTKAFSLLAISSIELIISAAITFVVYYISIKRNVFKESNRNLLSIGSVIFLVISILCYFAFSDVFESVIVLPTDLNIR
jgi:hypothetical protein